jgi:hypothetical protein
MAAATAAIAGLAATGVSTAMSFTQAAQQQKLFKQAQAKADQAMQEARKKLEVNYYDQLSIMKEPYELQRQAMLVQGAQSIEAAREADRGAAPTAGRLQAMQNEQQAGIRTAMGQELMGLEKLSATEEARLRDINVQLDLGEVAGAQLAAKDAQEARAGAIQQGMQGITGMMGYAGQLVPLYMQSAAGKQLGRQEAAYGKAAAAGTLPQQFKNPDGTFMNFQQALGTKYGKQFSSMEPSAFQSYMGGLSKSQIKEMYDPLAFQFPQTPQQRLEAEQYMRGTIGTGSMNPFEAYNTSYNPYLQTQPTGFNALGGYSPSIESFPMLDKF